MDNFFNEAFAMLHSMILERPLFIFFFCAGSCCLGMFIANFSDILRGCVAFLIKLVELIEEE